MKKIVSLLLVAVIMLSCVQLPTFAEENSKELEANQWLIDGTYYTIDFSGQVKKGASLDSLEDYIKFETNFNNGITDIAVYKGKVFVSFYNMAEGYFPEDNGWAVYDMTSEKWSGRPTTIAEDFEGSPGKFQIIDGDLYVVLEELNYAIYPTVYKTSDGITWEKTTLIPKGEVVSSWAEKEVAEAIALNLVPQAFQTGFNDDITRIEFCDLIVNYLSKKDWRGIDAVMESKNIKLVENPFKDTDAKNVIIAHSFGIINGKDATTFDPQGSITREEAAVMLYRTIKVFVEDTGLTPSVFNDNDFESWAKEPVGIISALKIMNGKSEGVFDPKGTYTKEQAYMTFDRLYKYLLNEY